MNYLVTVKYELHSTTQKTACLIVSCGTEDEAKALAFKNKRFKYYFGLGAGYYDVNIVRLGKDDAKNDVFSV